MVKMIKKINRWGGNNTGGKCYIPGKYIGKYALIKIIDIEEIESSDTLKDLLLSSDRHESTKEFMKRKEIRDKKLKKHLKKLKRLNSQKSSNKTK